MKKYIIIGTSLAGKTTIIKYLRSTTDFPISELDEELTELNNGKFPLDVKYKHDVLFPRVLEKILNRQKIIFFTNAWYFKKEDLEEAKRKGFQIGQLLVNLKVLKLRNERRMKDGYEDMSQYLEGMVKYQKDVEKWSLVDFVIDGEQSMEKVAEDILQVTKKVKG